MALARNRRELYSCLTGPDSATTERAPPEPAGLANVASIWRNRTARSLVAQC